MSRFFVCLVVSAAACGGALAQGAGQQAMLAVNSGPVEITRAAIAECRDRMLHKEFRTYRESAQCASPKIFAAWRDANYPHMDLITAWLNARETASEYVDAKRITPKEFERQMLEMTNRVTAEEQRRRAGLLTPSDSELQLQLPPEAAAEPSRESPKGRPAAKHSAANAAAPMPPR